MQAKSCRDTDRLRHCNSRDYKKAKGVAPAVRLEIPHLAVEDDGRSTNTYSR